MRALFTDEWNSLWHLVFGILAIQYPIIIPVFIGYQFLPWQVSNRYIDIAEFVIGWALAAAALNRELLNG